MLQRLLAAIRSFFMRSPAPTGAADCPLDIDALGQQLNLDQLGEQAGSRDLPASGASSPDDAERKVEAVIGQRMSALNDATNQHLGRYNTSISNTDINAQQQRLLNLSRSSTLRLRSLMTEARQALTSLKTEKQRYSDYLDDFKRRHQRRVDARYPTSRVFHYSVVAVLLLLEAALNGYFFARGSEFGLLGGVSQSITIAVLNILPAFFLVGLVLLRYSGHVSWWRRGLAHLALLAWMAWLLLFNLATAHYRDLLASQPEQALTQVLVALADQPLVLADINSWLLFCIGVLFAGIAAWEGFRSDDPYPGYGARQRWYLDLEDYYQQECQRLSDEGARVRADYLDEIERLSSQVYGLYPHLYHLVEQKRALIERHRHCLEDMHSAADALIHRYRQANRLARSTPAPTFFDDPPGQRIRQFTLIGEHDDHDKIAQQKQLFDEFPARIQQTGNDIEALYQQFLAEIQSIDPPLQQRDDDAS